MNIFKISVWILLIPIIQKATSQNPIYIPDTLGGNEFLLQLKNSSKEFYLGFQTQTNAYNGNYLGPTLILNKGQQIKIQVDNQLSETTTTHWHGLHVAPKNDGGPHNPIFPNTNWSPEFTVMDQAGTYWYHPHLHGKTFEQVIKGAAGLIIIHDQEEIDLKIPRTYSVDDIPLILQFQTVDPISKQISVNNDFDNVTMVNGTINPMLKCPAQIIRFRLLNASSRRVFNLGFNDDRTFYQIAGDAGLLNKPIPMKKIRLGTGERAEILVDFNSDQGKNLILKQYGNELPAGFPGGPAIMGMSPLGPLDNKIFDILNIHVTSQTNNSVTQIPAKLIENNPLSPSGAIERSIRFTAQPMMSMTNFFINGLKYDEHTINFTVNQKDKEIWNITNQTMMAHPFHIHGNSFYILSINGIDPPENMKGRKDVVLIPPMNGNVRIITQYNDFHDSSLPYMFHCHILSHEDDGMMGQFLVLESPTKTEQGYVEDSFKFFPSIAINKVLIETINTFIPYSIRIYDFMGNCLKHIDQLNSSYELDIQNLKQGFYLISILQNNHPYCYKIVKVN